MCQAFARNGNEVILLAPHFPGLYEKNVYDIYSFYGADKIFKIRKTLLFTPKNKIISYIYGLLYGMFILLINPDIVYGRDLSALYFSAILGKKVIWELHHSPKISEEKKVRSLLKSKYLQHIVVISNKLRETILPNVRGKKIIVAHDGADVAQCKCIEEVNRKFFKYNNELKIGYVGHLYPGKGGEIVLKLAEKLPDENFHVFGGYEEDILIFQKKARKNVIIHGFVEHSRISSILFYLDILLLPALNKVAPFKGDANKNNKSKFMSPLKLFEYMASGKPIISSDLPVLREVLRHKENAILCDPDNLDEWVDAIRLLTKDKNLSRKIGDNAKKEFEEKYTWLARAKRVLDKQ